MKVFAIALALCSVATAHPGALTCGDKQMTLGQKIMGLTVTPAPASAAAKITLSPATYKPGVPVTVTASGWPKGAYVALGVSGPGGGAPTPQLTVHPLLCRAPHPPEHPSILTRLNALVNSVQSP